MSIRDQQDMTPRTLINPKSVSAAIEYFFGRSELSQVVDQTNPARPVDPRTAAVGPRAGRLESQAGRVRSARRSHLALRPHLPDRDARRHEHRPDFVAVDLCPGRRLRLPDHPVPRGPQEEAHRQGDLAAGRRGIDGPPGAGRRPDRHAQDHAGPRHRPALGRLFVHPVGAGRVHRRFAEADGRRVGRADPVPGTRRRQPGARWAATCSGRRCRS